MDASSLRIGVCLLVTVIVACGASPPTNPTVDTTKIPLTTASEKARDEFLKGRWLLDNLRATDAHGYFQKAVAADPDFALAHLRVANTASSNQEFFDSLQIAVRMSINASEGERLLISAFEAGVAGNPESQLSNLEALVALFPEDERAHTTLGNFFFFNQQDYERAVNVYRTAIKINPDFAPPYNQLGYALRFIGDYSAAEEVFRRYTELIPDQPNPYDSYAELLMKMGRFEESISGYERALEIEPTFVASYIGIGNNQIFMSQFEQARSTFAKIDEIARSDAERRLACTWITASYLHEGDFESAHDEIQRRYDIAAETNDRSAMAGDLNVIGDIFLRAGRSAEAAEKYREQLEMMQDSDATDEIKEATARNLKYDLARVSVWNADIASATDLAETYRQEVAAHNIRFEVQRTHELDGMIAFAEGDVDAALGHFEQANQQDPQIWLLKARAFAANGDDGNARAACQHVIDFNQLNFNLAYVRRLAQDLLETLLPG
jgi:tetratricopeptide (TPR) repeat protein